MPRLSIGQHLKNIFIFRGIQRIKLFLLFLLPLSSAFAAQSLAQIKNEGYQFVLNQLVARGFSKQNVQIDLYSPDSRLKLQTCSQPIHYYFPENANLSGNSTLGIRCQQPAWNIFLPLRIHKISRVWIANQAFKRGDILTLGSLSLESRKINTRKKPLSSKFNTFSGLKTTHALRNGEIISLSDICLVCKGDKVKLEFRSKGLIVTMNGVSLENGIKGERISVRNSSSRKIVTGKVKSPGIIEMTL